MDQDQENREEAKGHLDSFVAVALEYSQAMEALNEGVEEVEIQGDTYDEEQAYQYAHEYGLSVEVSITVRWVLYTGGPGGEVTFELDPDGKIDHLRFVHLPWFDRIEFNLGSILSGDEYDAVVQFIGAATYLDDPSILLSQLEERFK